MNLFSGQAEGGKLQLFDDFALDLPADVRDGSRLNAGWRPDAIAIAPEAATGAFPAKVVTYEATGSETMVFAEKDGQAITVVTKARPRISSGDTIWLAPDPGEVHLFGEDEQRVN